MTTQSNHKTIVFLFGFFSFALINQSNAIDVREKLITKVYKCSEFAVEATITRPLMSYEYKTYQAPQSPRGYGGGGFGGVEPVVGSKGRGSSKGGGGLFGIPSNQGLGGGGGAAPPKPNANQSQPAPQRAMISYKTKDLTEIMNFIQNTVDPKGWSDGHARPNIQKIGDMLIIKQTQKNHDEIQKLLNMLKDAKKD